MILAQAFSRFVFDLDGVIWRGEEALPGAPETVRSLAGSGKRICFVTNNSSERHETYARKLGKMKVPGDANSIVTSADATAALIERDVPGARGRLAFVVGGDGLRDAVAGIGLRVAEGDEGVDASVVVIGLDRALTYEKLRIATMAIRAGATFIASNADPTFPAQNGMWPGAGAIVAALRASTDREPIVAGKPDPAILDIAERKLGGSPALFIGDRVDTDIVCARSAGWPSALVLTGSTGIPELAASPAWPDFIIRRLPDLLEDRAHPLIRSAEGPDLPAIATLLHAGGLMSGAARERIGRTIVADDDRTVIATAAWEQVGPSALVRSVAVDAPHRRAGVGTLVVAGTLRSIAASGARVVFCVTENAAGFFAGCGFRAVGREELPELVAQHPQVTRECSAAATTMRLELPQ